MTTFYAQPYDITASGFYFETAEHYEEKIGSIRNESGQPVEEFELQFIDGERINAALAEAWNLNQVNIFRFLEAIEEWDEGQKQNFIIAVGELGYEFDRVSEDPDCLDLDIYEVGSLRELAEQFVDEGLFGRIPEHLAAYIDHDAIARDLAIDYTETEIAGTRLMYRFG